MNKLEFHPVTSARWKDLERLFGPNGACGGGWCMWWRLSNREFKVNKGVGNKRKLKKLMVDGIVPGLLAYDGKLPVWSIVCLFVTRTARRKGISVALIKAAAEYVKKQGGHLIEGYPTEANKEHPAPFVWMGVASAFREAGFEEAARRSPTRPIMRRYLRATSQKSI